MRKLQILLPEPVMRRLRRRAQWEDRPMSELVRRATERWLDSLPETPPELGGEVAPPTFRLGLKVRDPRELKEMLYDRDEERR